MRKDAIAIIGGSGLYDLDGMTDVHEHEVDTPYGPPSSPVVAGVLGARRVMFLARHVAFSSSATGSTPGT